MTAPPVTPPKEPPKEPAPQPTPQPPSPTSPFSHLSGEEKDKMLQIQQANLREEIRKREENEKRLKALEDQLKTIPKPPEPDKKNEFWTDPMSVIRKELGEQIKPIMDIAKGLQDKDEYTTLKDR